MSGSPLAHGRTDAAALELDGNQTLHGIVAGWISYAYGAGRTAPTPACQAASPRQRLRAWTST